MYIIAKSVIARLFKCMLHMRYVVRVRATRPITGRKSCSLE
jgi:hypothetical protein